MVVNHIHHHADAVIVERFHHLLHLFYPEGAVEGICGVGAFGNIEILRIIAPVELGFREGFVGEAIVKYGQQMHMGHAQGLDVVKARRTPGSGLGPRFCQT